MNVLKSSSPPSSSAPWSRVTDRLSCLTDDPACRSNALIHAGILLLIILLAASRKLFLAMSRLDGEENKTGEKNFTWPEKFSMAEVDSIWVYPIKSAQGVRLSESMIARKGIDLDRRWIVLKKDKNGEWVKVILKDEPRMVMIQTAIDEETSTLRVSASPLARRPDLKPFALPLQVDKSWQLQPKIEMYGDAADGRIVQQSTRVQSEETRHSPSEWVSALLGYDALLVQYEPEGTQRAAYPLYKGSALPRNGKELEELKRPRGIAFADEYPLLVASTASLAALQAQIRDAVMATDGTDGRGGKPIGNEKMFKQQTWRERILADDARALKRGMPKDGGDADSEAATWLTMIRFRPNIVLKSCSDSTVGKPLEAWEEDNWQMITVNDASSSAAAAAAADRPLPEIHCAAECKRCLMTTTDPLTSERIDASVPLAFLRRSHNIVKAVPLDKHGTPSNDKDALAKAPKGPCFGVYAVVPADKGGVLRVGDVVRCPWIKGA